MHETSPNKLTKLIPKLGVDYYYDDGAPLYYTPYGKAGAQFKAKKVADEFADYCEWFYKNNPEAEEKSVDELVRSFVKKHDLITEDERLWAPQATREVSKHPLKNICLSRPRRNYSRAHIDSTIDRALDRHKYICSIFKTPQLFCYGA